MNVLLICAAGMSTSMLTTSMRKYAEPGEVVEAQPFTELRRHIDRFDVVLLGPQIRFKLPEVEMVSRPKGVPVAVIDMRVYGMMDGRSAMAQARSLVG